MAAPQPLVWTEVDSSNVQAVAYIPESEVIAVKFKNGGLYSYEGADNEFYVSLVHAPSVGKYLNSTIKVLFPYRKWNDEDELIAAMSK